MGPRPVHPAFLAAFLPVALLLAACGGDSSPASTSNPDAQGGTMSASTPSAPRWG